MAIRESGHVQVQTCWLCWRLCPEAESLEPEEAQNCAGLRLAMCRDLKSRTNGSEMVRDAVRR